MGCHAGNHIEIDVRATGENQVSIGKRYPLAVRAYVLDLVLLQINAGYCGCNPGGAGAICRPGITTSSAERERPATSASIGVKTMWFSLLITTTSTLGATRRLSRSARVDACESPAHDDDSRIFHSRNLLYCLYCLRTRGLRPPHSSHRRGTVQPGSSHSDDLQVLEHVGDRIHCINSCLDIRQMIWTK